MSFIFLTPGTISAFPSSLHSATFALICSRTSPFISPVSPKERKQKWCWDRKRKKNDKTGYETRPSKLQTCPLILGMRRSKGCNFNGENGGVLRQNIQGKLTFHVLKKASWVRPKDQVWHHNYICCVHLNKSQLTREFKALLWVQTCLDKQCNDRLKAPNCRAETIITWKKS